MYNSTVHYSVMIFIDLTIFILLQPELKIDFVTEENILSYGSLLRKLSSSNLFKVFLQQEANLCLSPRKSSG